MSRIAEANRAISPRLARVLGDVGINRDMVLRRRRTYMLWETLDTIGYKVRGDCDLSVFIFGSQTEGTTSPQLMSDIDSLVCMNNVNVIQDWSEWQRRKSNFLILRDQTTGPGYCRLQRLRSNVPLPHTQLLPDDPRYTMDESSRILVRNTCVHDKCRSGIPNFINMEGPAASRYGGEGCLHQDIIYAFSCPSWPHEARSWLERRRNEWPPISLVQLAANSGCFIVAKGQKMSPFQHLEWRISTSLAERMLMFSMNITQLQCYYSLKVITKTFITNRIGKCVSSYHCKTVVFYCIESSSAQLWREDNLFVCIRYCLQQLWSYMTKGHLPNYFIPEDDLIADRINQYHRSQIIEILNELLSGRGEFLLSICIDDIGQRLLNAFNIIPAVNVEPSGTLCQRVCGGLASIMYRKISHVLKVILCSNNSAKVILLINSLMSLAHRGTYFQQLAARFFLPSLCSSLGSMIAASDISRGRDLSPAVTALFRYGVQSDAASSRLKFASLLYCRGEFMRAAQLLEDIERRCGRSEIHPVCACYNHPVFDQFRKRFSTYSYDAEEKDFSQNIAYCVRFLPSERPCVPPELQYEMSRSFGDDIQYRGPDDKWMDWSVIDSLPFLHYLQYLVYRQLGTNGLKWQAIFNLTADMLEPNLGHRETLFNLQGKCMEQENNFIMAYVCYADSLRLRPRNNAAKYHMTYLMYQLYQKPEQEQRQIMANVTSLLEEMWCSPGH